MPLSANLFLEFIDHFRLCSWALFYRTYRESIKWLLFLCASVVLPMHEYFDIRTCVVFLHQLKLEVTIWPRRCRCDWKSNKWINKSNGENTPDLLWNLQWLRFLHKEAGDGDLMWIYCINIHTHACLLFTFHTYCTFHIQYCFRNTIFIIKCTVVGYKSYAHLLFFKDIFTLFEYETRHVKMAESHMRTMKDKISICECATWLWAILTLMEYETYWKN